MLVIELVLLVSMNTMWTNVGHRARVASVDTQYVDEYWPSNSCC